MDVQEYVERYLVETIWSNEDHVHVARCPQWPSLTVHGDSSEAATAEFRKLLIFAIEDCLEAGDTFPLV